jgi:hypothetical protein
MNIEGLQDDAFSSLFAVGKADGAISHRSGAQLGWKLGKSFLRTASFEYDVLQPAFGRNIRKKEASKGKVDPKAAFAPIDETVSRLGWTPESSTSSGKHGNRRSGSQIVYTSRSTTRRVTSTVCKARERRAWIFAKESHGISNTRKKTGNLGEFEDVRVYNIYRRSEGV